MYIYKLLNSSRNKKNYWRSYYGVGPKVTRSRHWKAVETINNIIIEWLCNDLWKIGLVIESVYRLFENTKIIEINSLILRYLYIMLKTYI